MNPLSSAVIDWYEDNRRDLPWRRPGFTAWGTLVSEFMLQQTPVQRVIPRLEEWLERWPTPGDLAASPSGDAVRAWANLGYPRRALWLHRAAEQIVERHGGEVPNDVEALLALTGIGDYTARAVAVFAYGSRHPVVDTNTRRVIARAVHGNAEAAPPRRTDLDDMEALLPDDITEQAVVNAGMMELGALVCTAKNPRCDSCPLQTMCQWRLNGSPRYDGPKRAVQKKYEGSDRHVRGLIMAQLRERPRLSREDISILWPDSVQLERALGGLLADGLAIDESAHGTDVGSLPGATGPDTTTVPPSTTSRAGASGPFRLP
ncbi:MAG: A/G-specific adenine glycosylase [Mycetocola sp.]